jgi:hypothetical protein
MGQEMSEVRSSGRVLAAEEIVTALLRGFTSLLPGGGLLGELAGLGLLVAGRLDRMRHTAVAMAEAAGGPEYLTAGIRTSEDVEILVIEALEHASRTPLAAKRRLLAKVVAQASLDTAQIDESQLLVAALKELEAPHVRALERLRQLHTDPRAQQIREEQGHRSKAVPADEWDEPSPVVAALLRTGCVYELRAFVGGGVAGYYTTEFGRKLLDALMYEHEPDA